MLKSEGISQVRSIGQLEEQTFCQDPHCRDLLVFPSLLKADLCRTELLSDRKLIIQVEASQREEAADKGSSSQHTLSNCGNLNSLS